MKALERAVAVVNRIITKSTVKKGNKGTTDAKSKVCIPSSPKWQRDSSHAQCIVTPLVSRSIALTCLYCL